MSENLQLSQGLDKPKPEPELEQSGDEGERVQYQKPGQQEQPGGQKASERRSKKRAARGGGSGSGGSSGKLTPNQEKAIALLLETGDIPATAERLGVSRTTLDRWMNNPLFFSELKERQRQIINGAVLTLVGGTKDAVKVIRDIMDDKNAKPSTRLRAAELYLSSTAKFMELYDTEERLTRLEKQVYEQQQVSIISSSVVPRGVISSGT